MQNPTRTRLPRPEGGAADGAPKPAGAVLCREAPFAPAGPGGRSGAERVQDLLAKGGPVAVLHEYVGRLKCSGEGGEAAGACRAARLARIAAAEKEQAELQRAIDEHGEGGGGRRRTDGQVSGGGDNTFFPLAGELPCRCLKGCRRHLKSP